MAIENTGWSATGHILADRLMATLRLLFERKTVPQAHKLAHRLIEEALGRYRRDPEAAKIACRSRDCFGCCLHQTEIDVSAFEVERILDQVEADSRLPNVVQHAERLSQRGRGGVCPLLSHQGSCTVYKIRPLTCAAYHSLDRQACHSGATAKIKHAEMLWIETALIAGFGMVPPDEMTGGKPITRFRLFDELARRGRARLERKAAA